GEVLVSVHATPEEDSPGSLRIAIHVTDTGIGVATEKHERLFKQFSQVDGSTARRFGGAGIGLSLSRRLARMLGGDVELLTSVPGMGSTFAIWFVTPDTQAKAPPAPRVEQDPRGAEQRSIAGLRILVAEDAPDTRFLVQSLLASHGASVGFAENGREAVDKAL